MGGGDTTGLLELGEVVDLDEKLVLLTHPRETGCTNRLVNAHAACSAYCANHAFNASRASALNERSLSFATNLNSDTRDDGIRKVMCSEESEVEDTVILWYLLTHR